jgi:hypothetical protein
MTPSIPHPSIRFHLAALALPFFIATSALAEPAPSCKPVVAALDKVFSIDHAETTVTNAQSAERLQVGGVAYLNVRGKWSRSPLTPTDSLQTIHTYQHDAKVYDCRALSDATVDGVPAQVYSIHIEHDDAISDVKLSLSKETGLPLSTVQDIRNDEGKRHTTTTFRYEGLKAPT